MDLEIEKLKELIKRIKPFFVSHNEAFDIQVKGVADFVTQVDFQVQEMMKNGLKELYPKIQFMGEEKDNSDIDFQKPVWILDPVDGTTNLIHDYHQSALSLALCVEREIVLGIVYQPYTDEMFLAQRGKGAWLNGSPIHVSGIDRLEESLVAIGTSPWAHDRADENFGVFKEIFSNCTDIRRTGSAAYDLACVACGRTEAFVERNLKPWDFSAGLLLVREAGGTVSDYEGGEIDFTGPSDIVAGNGCIGEKIVEDILKKL